MGYRAAVKGFEVYHRITAASQLYELAIFLFRGLRPEAGNAGSHGDLSHIPLEVLELQLRSAHVRSPKPSPKA